VPSEWRDLAPGPRPRQYRDDVRLGLTRSRSCGTPEVQRDATIGAGVLRARQRGPRPAQRLTAGCMVQRDTRRIGRSTHVLGVSFGL
jgi:hypothetical protein